MMMKDVIYILTNDSDAPFQSLVITGIRQIAQAKGYHVQVAVIDKQQFDPQDMMTAAIAGLVVIADAAPDEYLRQVYHQKIPITLVSHQLPDLPIPAVMSDDREGIKALMHHLIVDRQRRQPVFIRGIPEQRDSIEREQAFKNELLRYNIPPQDYYILDGNFSAPVAAQSIQHLLESGAAFDCVLAADYVMGIAVVEVLRAAGLDVPHQVAVVGYGDEAHADVAGLTTVSANIIELGGCAARQLISQIQGLHIQGITTVSVALIIRHSS